MTIAALSGDISALTRSTIAFAIANPGFNNPHMALYRGAVQSHVWNDATQDYLEEVDDKIVDLEAINKRLKYCPELIRDCLIDAELATLLWLNAQLR